MRVTAQNLVRAINNLPRDRVYNYVHKANRGHIVIHRVQEPEGPIEIKRYNPEKGGTLAKAKVESISTQMLWRLANAILPEMPVNVDRVFGGSYNTRSVLETLLAHTSLFYACRPDRIEQSGSSTSVKKGHKHLLYLPNEPHVDLSINWKEVDLQISEIALPDVAYQGIDLETLPIHPDMSVGQRRRHAQIQVLLVLIGQQLGFKTWVAANDHAIQYAGERIIEMDSVVKRLSDEKQMVGYPEAASAARLIDCVWFKNGRLMPAVMEVEQSTGVTSGLVRMKGFYDLLPPNPNYRWTIVAPDEDRSKVYEKANRDQFRDLDTRFFPYSAVEELYSLCDRRKPEGVTDQFLDCFMERCLA